MAFQTRYYYRKIITTNSQFVNNQAAAAGFNNPVQMGSVNPFGTTVEDPWLGINHMLLGSNNMVIQPLMNATISAHSGTANMQLPNGQRKRSRVSSNQVNNLPNVYYPVPDYATQHIEDEMITLSETDGLVFKQSKRLRIMFAEKQNQAVQHLVESVRTPILMNILKEQNAEISNLGRLNYALYEGVNDLFDENQKLIENANTCKIKAMSLHTNLEVALAEVKRLQGLVHANCAVAPFHEEQDVMSYCGSNVVSAENTPWNSEEVSKVEDGETAAEKVQTGAAETGEGSGEKSMCKSCGEMETSVLALPCCHLCFCIVCGTRESLLSCPCPVCETTVNATTPISLV